MEWDDVTKLVQLLKEHNLGEIEYEDERFRLKLKMPSLAPVALAAPPVVAAAPVAAASAGARGGKPEEPVSERGKLITSPFVGTFYRQPAPDSPPYVEVGQSVTKGQILCIVEAMKLMNEIESDVSGRVVRITVENGRPVEYGEPLFVIEPL